MIVLGHVQSGTPGFCGPLNIVAATGPALGRRDDTTQQESEDRPYREPNLSSRFQETHSTHRTDLFRLDNKQAHRSWPKHMGVVWFILMPARIDYKQNFGSGQAADRL